MDLRQKEEELKLTQSEMASFLGIKKQSISLLRKGERRLSEAQMQYLTDLEKFQEMKNPLELKFDYVRIRFETTELREITENVLLLDLDWLDPEDHGWYGYTQHLAFGNIVIMYDTEDKKRGVLFELKGGGCRHFEQILHEQKRTWHDFFTNATAQGAIIKRIDLAIDDKTGILDIPFFIEKTKRGECDTIFRRYDAFSNAENKKFKKEENKKIMGTGMYIGSRKSNIYFCLYEKDYEQYVKTGIPTQWQPVRNRFEIRLKDERAENAIKAYVLQDDLEALAFGIIERYVSFKDKKRGVELDDCPVNKRWAIFMQEVREEIRLTTDPEEITLEDTWRWIETQVAPTLKVLMHIDGERLDYTVGEATLSSKQENILKSHDIKIEDVII